MTASAQALSFVAADYDAGALSKAGAVTTETSSTAMAATGNIASVVYSETSADVIVGYTSWQPAMAGANVVYIGGSYKVGDKLGFALSFTSVGYPKYEVFEDFGPSQGAFKPSDMQLNIGAAYRVLPYVSAGVNLGYASSALAEDVTYGGFRADVFLMSKLLDFKIALGVSDLGTSIESASGVSFSLPTALTLGLGYEKEYEDIHKDDLALDADFYWEGAFATSVGAEYIFKDMISCSAGYRYGGKSIIPSYASLGLGGCVRGISLELAYILPLAEVPMSNTLSIAVGYSF